MKPRNKRVLAHLVIKMPTSTTRRPTNAAARKPQRLKCTLHLPNRATANDDVTAGPAAQKLHEFRTIITRRGHQPARGSNCDILILAAGRRGC